MSFQSGPVRGFCGADLGWYGRRENTDLANGFILDQSRPTVRAVRRFVLESPSACAHSTEVLSVERISLSGI